MLGLSFPHYAKSAVRLLDVRLLDGALGPRDAISSLALPSSHALGLLGPPNNNLLSRLRRSVDCDFNIIPRAGLKVSALGANYLVNISPVVLVEMRQQPKGYLRIVGAIGRSRKICVPIKKRFISIFPTASTAPTPTAADATPVRDGATPVPKYVQSQQILLGMKQHRLKGEERSVHFNLDPSLRLDISLLLVVCCVRCFCCCVGCSSCSCRSSFGTILGI
mmetsp:Transcript_8103/g.16915  ORF Transcript_8103/g.16915 Transcript_8103/m.16915 type:complete len:221 (+) Transcript_8103:355-1017(+)